EGNRRQEELYCHDQGECFIQMHDLTPSLVHLSDRKFAPVKSAPTYTCVCSPAKTDWIPPTDQKPADFRALSAAVRYKAFAGHSTTGSALVPYGGMRDFPYYLF